MPLQLSATTRQCAVTVTGSGAGPHVALLARFTVRLALVGLLTEVLKFTFVVFGAHFTNSPTLPEPALPEKVIVTGFDDQTAFGAERAAKPTAAYAPTMTRLMERPTSSCGRYLLIGDNNCNSRG